MAIVTDVIIVVSPLLPLRNKGEGWGGAESPHPPPGLLKLPAFDS